MRLALGAALAAVLTAALTSCLTAAEGEITRRISNELELNYNNVSGAGASQSTLSEKFNIIENIQLNQGVDSEKNSYWLNLGGRGTDDRTVDLRPLSLTNLQLKMGSGPVRWTLGDTFEYFSQYTLSSSLKGISYTFHDESDRLPAVTLIYGVG